MNARSSPLNLKEFKQVSRTSCPSPWPPLLFDFSNHYSQSCLRKYASLTCVAITQCIVHITCRTPFSVCFVSKNCKLNVNLHSLRGITWRYIICVSITISFQLFVKINCKTRLEKSDLILKGHIYHTHTVSAPCNV